MDRRVVVTGMGVISPIGNDVKTFWDSLLAGKCGIAPIAKFDTEKFKVKNAAEVKDFDPLQYMDKSPDSRRLSRTPEKQFPAGVFLHAPAPLRQGAPQEYGLYCQCDEYLAVLHQNGLYGFSTR